MQPFLCDEGRVGGGGEGASHASVPPNAWPQILRKNEEHLVKPSMAPRSNTLGIVVRTPVFALPNAPPPHLATQTERATEVVYMDPQIAFALNVTSILVTSMVVMCNIAYLVVG